MSPQPSISAESLTEQGSLEHLQPVPHDPFLPSVTTHETNAFLPLPSPVHEDSLATSLITDSDLEFKSTYEETLATVFMDFPPEEASIYDYRKTALYAYNTALMNSPSDRTHPEVLASDLNHPTLIELATPPQIMECEASALDITPQTVRNMPKINLRNPEIERPDRWQSMLTSQDESLEPQFNERQTSNFLQHRVTQQELLTGTTQSNKSTSHKLEEKNSPQCSLTLNSLQNTESEHFQDSPRLTNTPSTLKTDHSDSYEMSDRNMMISSRSHFIANHGSPEKPTISSASLKSKLSLSLAEENGASKETINPEEFATSVQPQLSEIAKENEELRENIERILKELDESTERECNLNCVNACR